MTEVLTKSQTSPHPPPADSSTAPIGIKLDGSNYALWSQVVEMYISLAKTSWDISMETLPNLRKPIHLSGDGELKMPL